MDIEELRKKSKDGSVEAQKELAHAYLGRTTRYTEYILRFKDEKYQESWPKSGFWENPDYPMEHESASLERIDDYRVKITMCYEHIP